MTSTFNIKIGTPLLLLTCSVHINFNFSTAFRFLVKWASERVQDRRTVRRTGKTRNAAYWTDHTTIKALSTEGRRAWDNIVRSHLPDIRTPPVTCPTCPAYSFLTLPCYCDAHARCTRRCELQIELRRLAHRLSCVTQYPLIKRWIIVLSRQIAMTDDRCI